MSRSGYTDECDESWELIMWRGAVASAIRGKRGQAFLKEMLAALDALPEKKLIADDIVKEGACCAIGSVALARGTDVRGLDPTDRRSVAKTFGIAKALVAEISYMNDEGIWGYRNPGETPEHRWTRMRKWVVDHIAVES